MVHLQHLYDKLVKQIQIVEDALKTTDIIGSKLATLKIPKNDASSTDKCRNSAFRSYKFRFKPSIEHSILENKTNQIITFSGLCELLTLYVLNKNLLNETNTITCDNFLKLLTENDITSFFMLLKSFGRIIA